MTQEKSAELGSRTLTYRSQAGRLPVPVAPPVKSAPSPAPETLHSNSAGGAGVIKDIEGAGNTPGLLPGIAAERLLD